jgi:NAD(P)-dependent dehydrogenase (short-subunit alcohol dehydrogenase family)
MTDMQRKRQTVKTSGAVNSGGDRVVLVTGGASGIGLETARRLAAAGYRAVLVVRDGEQVRAAAAALGERHLGVAADVTDEASLERAVELAVERFGGIDAVIANAGIGSASTVRASSTEQLLRIVDVNLSGQIRTVKAVLEQIIASRGYIAFTCSAAVLKNTPKSSAYAAAKAGVEAFAGALRQEVAHRGVDVGVFYPGWTRTPLIQNAGSRAAEGSKSLPWPLSVTSEVDEVADAYAHAVEQRSRTAYYPRAHRFVHWLRPLYTGAAWDRRLSRDTERKVRAWEADFLREAGSR